MITLKIKGNERPSKYWTLSLPDHGGQVSNVLERARIDFSSMDQNCLVLDVKSELPMEHLKGQKINLHEASHLFEQLFELKKDDLQLFAAVLRTGKFSLKEMINITLNLDCYDVLDSTAVEQVYKKSEPIMTKYDEISLPPLYGTDSVMIAKIASNMDGRFSYLSLPCHVRWIEDAVQIIGCEVGDQNYTITYPLSRLEDEFFNSISHKIFSNECSRKDFTFIKKVAIDYNDVQREIERNRQMQLVQDISSESEEGMQFLEMS